MKLPASISGICWRPRLFKIICLGVFLAVFQQWCGINVIFNYAQEVFASAGFGVSATLFNIVITGIVNLVFTFVAIFTVDRIGRKPLMLLGSVGLAGVYAVLGTGYYLHSTGIHMLFLVVLAIACYSMTLAPIVVGDYFGNIHPTAFAGRPCRSRLFRYGLPARL